MNTVMPLFLLAWGVSFQPPATVPVAPEPGNAAERRSPPPPSIGPVATPPRLRSGYISNADYPRDALRAGAEGTASVRLDISRRGRVTNCTIVRSSEHAALDAVTCAIATERFRFTPARNPAGQAVDGTYIQSISWRLPAATPPVPKPD